MLAARAREESLKTESGQMRWRALRFSEDALRLRSPQAARPEWVSFPVTAAVLLCLFRLDPQSFSLKKKTF